MPQRLLFDRSQLQIKPISERKHDLDLEVIKALDYGLKAGACKDFLPVARSILSAKKKGAAVILMIGGHVVRDGVQRYIIDLMRRGHISCIAMNGAGVIHDFEMALIGATTESVAKYIRHGQFGLWKETARINDYINRGNKKGLGLGEAVGSAIAAGDFPYKEISLLAAGFRLEVPVTVHVGIGYDIIHQHPNCDGAATGAASYRDFLRFARIAENLENGVVMNFGSSVMAPEVFLKALSMARNIARQQRRQIRHFTALVCDLYPLPKDISQEADKDSPAYYFRPWKTMLVRTVAAGGKAFYIRGKHVQTIPGLWQAINKTEHKKCA